MDEKIKSLIATGAAAAENCRPCLENLVSQCIKAGASKDDVQDAIETGFQGTRDAHAKTQGDVDVIMTDEGQSIDELGCEPRTAETVAANGCC